MARERQRGAGQNLQGIKPERRESDMKKKREEAESEEEEEEMEQVPTRIQNPESRTDPLEPTMGLWLMAWNFSSSGSRRPAKFQLELISFQVPPQIYLHSFIPLVSLPLGL